MAGKVDRPQSEPGLNQSLDLSRPTALTRCVTAARTVRADRATSTQEAILKAAERLYAEHGVYAVSNRQVSEAAGQGNNAAVGYHFGTKTDLVRAIEQKHRASIERLLESMVAQARKLDRAAGLDRVPGVLAHRAPGPARATRRGTRGSPPRRWPTPPTKRSSSRTRWRRHRWCRSSRASPAACPNLPMAVVTERNIMARNLMMHTCADFERAFAEGAGVPRTSWSAVASGLIDAIVGLWQAPVTEHP